MNQGLLNINLTIPIILPLVIILFLFFLFRYIKKKSKQEREKQTEISFMAQTFHQLVTQLKEKERELERLKKIAEERADFVESYSNNIIQSVPSGVVSFDNNLIVTKVNTAASKILEIKPEEMVGKSYTEIFLPPLTELLLKREPISRAECTYTLKNGRKIYLGLTLSQLFNQRGEQIGYVLVFTDLTELKTLESQMKLRQWLSSLGEVSLGIAHELRNPMAVISGYAKILSKKGDNLPEVKAIMDEINVMNRIIEDFHSFSKSVKPNLQKIDLKSLLEKSVMHILKKREDVEVSLSSDDIWITTDEVLLKQAINNLLQNAIEAMPEGGRLDITVRSGSADRGEVEIIIQDTGSGIPEEIRDKVFLPFYTTKDSGSGLGLAIVHKNISILNGRISFDSSREGTRFKIVLPQDYS
jgi:PAS domain S-box-containing protein